MDKIGDIVNDIYDPKIEDPKHQGLMASCIRAWLRDAVFRGMDLGRGDLALELDKTIKKNMNPGETVIVLRRCNP